MKNLDDTVREVVQQFVRDGLLFTGLDVSNKVKETLPFARHSEISDLVRQMFVTEMEPACYAKTPISVTLKDGSVRTALLYHALSDLYDLDNKYDLQKRTQTAIKPVAPVPATVSANGTITVTPTPAAIKNPVSVVAPTAARDLWAGMFNSQPSLFPRK